MSSPGEVSIGLAGVNENQSGRGDEMQCYEKLTTNQLERHRALLVSMLGEIDLELAKRISEATNADEMREALQGISREELARCGIV